MVRLGGAQLLSERQGALKVWFLSCQVIVLDSAGALLAGGMLAGAMGFVGVASSCISGSLDAKTKGQNRLFGRVGGKYYNAAVK